MSLSTKFAPPLRRTLQATKSPLLRHWAGLLALLVTEATVLSLRFDAASADVDVGGWGHLIARYFKFVPQVGIVALLATLLTCGSWLRDDLRLALGSESRRPIWTWLLVHLGSFLAFAGLTWMVIEGDVDTQAVPQAWLIAWVCAGLATLVTWACAALPMRFWRAVARNGAWFFSCGMAFAVVAVFFSRYAGKSWRLLATPTLWLSHHLLRICFSDVVCNTEDLKLGTPISDRHRRQPARATRASALISLTMGLVLLVWPAASVSAGLPAATAGTVAMGLARGPDRGADHRRDGHLPRDRVGRFSFPGRLAHVHRCLPRAHLPQPSVGVSGTTGLRIWFHHCLRARARSRPVPRRLARPTLLPHIPPRPMAACWPIRPPPAPPVEALVGTMMVTTALSSGFDWLYPIRVFTTGLVLWIFRRHYHGLVREWSWPAVAAGIAVFGLWMLLEPAPEWPEAATLPESMSPTWRYIWIASKLIGSIVTVPIAEELAFRGYLLRRLIASDFQAVSPRRFTWASFMVSSLAFGLLHGRWVAGTFAGMLYALALYRRGRLGEAVLAHSLTNALIAAAVLTTDAWYLWS